MASVVKQIKTYNKSIRPDMKARKWAALKESPFRFFRGTCHLFAADFEREYGFGTKVKTWICGDLHFENFGSYKGANRLVYFDVNDFDESLLAIPEADIARFLTSIIIAGQQMKVAEHGINETIKNVTNMYANTLAAEKALMMEAALAKGVLEQYFKQLSIRNRQAFITKHTEKRRGKLFLKYDDVHFLPITATEKQLVYNGLKPLLEKNKHFAHLSFEDAAYRIAGTGSLGLDRYGVLCYDQHKDKHYLIDVKEARMSCYCDVADIKQPAFDNEAARVNYAQYTMQFNTADFLATTHIRDKWFMVKELQPVIDKMALPSFNNNFGTFSEAAMDMAPLIAYAHLRGSGHKGAATADELGKFGGKKQWQKDIVELSWELAAYNNGYYKQFAESENV